MQALRAWGEQHGVASPKFGISAAHNRTWVAAEEVEPGERLISVPVSLLLHAEVGLSDPVYGEALRALRAEAGTELDNRVMLVLTLMLERLKGCQSRWATYINHLPEEYDDPTWWDERDAALLNGSCAAPVLRGYRLALKKLTLWRGRLFELHAQLGGSVPAGGGTQWVLSAVALLWARSTVWSRAFNATITGSQTVVLVPVVDMLDHHPDSKTQYIVKDDQFQLTAHTRVQKGQTLYISYGHKSNEELLLGYGFVLPHNVANFVKVAISPATRQGDGSRAGLVVRDSVKAMLRLPDDHFLRVADPLPSSLLAAASIALLSEPRAQRAHGLLQRSLMDNGTRLAAAGPAAAPQHPDAGETAMDSPSSQLVLLPPPSLPANVSSLVMGSPQEQLHALRAVLRNLKAKLADLGDSPEEEPLPGDHASLALQYMAEQRSILKAAMHDLLQRVTDLLHHASKYITGRAQQQPHTKVLSSKVAEMTTDIAANRARQPLQGVGTTGNCARSQHRQGGIKVLEDAVPGDVLVAVPKDEVLVASSREELVLAVMEAMHDSNTASGSVQHPAWVHAVGRLSGRLAPRLLAGCCSGEVLDALSGTAVEQAVADEVQDLQHHYAALRGALSESQRTRLAAISTASDQRMEHQLPAPGSFLASFATAAAAVEERSVPGPGASEICIAPGGLSAVPEAFRDIAVSWSWEHGGSKLVLRAVCALPAGVLLTGDMLLLGADAEQLLLTDGPEAVAEAERLSREEHVGRPLFGEVMLRHSYELHLSAPEEDPLQQRKDDVLACCALDGPLFLTADVLCEEWPLAVIALLAMKAEQLDAVQKLIAAQTNSGAVIICKTRLVRVLCSSTLVPYIAGRCTNRRSNRMTCAGGTPSQIRDSTTAHLLESRSACKAAHKQLRALLTLARDGMATASKPESREPLNAAADDGHSDAHHGATIVLDGQKAVLQAWLARVSRKDISESGAKRKRRSASVTQTVIGRT